MGRIMIRMKDSGMMNLAGVILKILKDLSLTILSAPSIIQKDLPLISMNLMWWLSTAPI